jgi:hypothetical protein
VFSAEGVRIAGTSHPIEESGPARLISGGHESEEIEVPTFGSGVMGIPHIQDETSTERLNG